MNNQEFDSLLRRVVVDSIRNYTEQFSNKDLLFSPSVGYGRQVRMMLSNPLGWAKGRMLPIWKKTLRAVAMIFITIFVAMGCLIAFSSPVRAVVTRWVQEVYEKYFVYRFSGDSNNSEMKDYEITDLPYGYSEYERNEYLGMVHIVYKKSENECIYLRYVSMEDGYLSSFVIDEENRNNAVDVKINEMDGKYWASSNPDKMSTLVWFDQDENLQFTVDANLSYVDILHICRSVSLCKDTKS